MLEMGDIRVGLAGAGYWGSKLARNLYEAGGCHLSAVCDPDELRRDEAIRRYPSCQGIADFEDLLASPDLDAIVLATPAALHAEHTGAALRAGKHVLVEKPLALSSEECEELSALADDADLTLMVGHTFIYSEPVRALRRLIQAGDLGTVLYVYGQRLNLGIIREDLNALWNFGPHDVSILLYLLDELPIRVSAQQFPVLNRSLEDVVFLVLEFPSGVVGHVHESWLDPRKVRQFTVVGDEKMAVYDDTQVESPILIYDKGVSPLAFEETGESSPGRRMATGFAADGRLAPLQGADADFGTFKLEVRAGDIVSPRIEAREPLRAEIEHFVECLSTGTRPQTDAEHGRHVVSLLECAERSASEGGRWVEYGEAVTKG
jgi:predicted dehydrogenase